ncbi:hypothetical protein BIW11_12400 [Tropilaelaps mercedesae]|uniref:Uncharacterized protein n=1 Tax=Tropilaelaps mercedesae TaxID=418985 RepID=A0A1V9X6S2_9ACAR|nr:hypothetical protein BIW11_12400 [Tropilaelaps mercedesae]
MAKRSQLHGTESLKKGDFCITCNPFRALLVLVTAVASFLFLLGAIFSLINDKQGLIFVLPGTLLLVLAVLVYTSTIREAWDREDDYVFRHVDAPEEPKGRASFINVCITK